MTDIAITPSTFDDGAVAGVPPTMTPAILGIMGIMGAVTGLFGMIEIFSLAAIPMGLLAVVLGRHSASPAALGLGTLGVVCAMAGLINSSSFWLVFAALLGAV